MIILILFKRRTSLFDAPMSTEKYQIALLYNDDSHASHGSPQDLLAVQSTISTSQNLHQALLSLGYPTVTIAVRDSLEDLARTLRGYSPASTFIFNNCDGFDGSNQDAALVVHLLEELGFKHTGGLADAVELCIDKPRAKRCLEEHGIPTPRFQVFGQPDEEFHLHFPVIIKPAVEDGSMGITLESVVSTLPALRRQVGVILETYAELALLEEFIPGRELAVALMGNDPMEHLPIAEQDYHLIPDPLEHLLTYESKWETDSPYFNNILSSIPADLTPADEKILRAAAEDTFHAIGLRDFARVDIRFHDGTPYIIDVNELPDLAPDGGFWRSAEAAGMTYPQMVEKIILHAFAREGWTP
jgi:D-alanine-D-alanine ligase